MEIPVLLPGDEIEYRKRTGGRNPYVDSKKGRSTHIDRKAIIIQDAGKYWTVNLGKYRDTIMKNDLITGDVVIVSVEEGAEAMATKLEMPAVEQLQELFEQTGGNILKAAKQIVPPVSDATMRKWWIAAGIIQVGEKRPAPLRINPPAAGELRAEWEENRHSISALARKYEVSGVTIKKWLKVAGIITEGPTGIETLPDRDNALRGEAAADVVASDQADQPAGDDAQNEYDLAGFGPENDKPIPYILTKDEILKIWEQIAAVSVSLKEVTSRLVSLEKTVSKAICNPDDAADQARIKKLVEFLLAPLLGRVERLEGAACTEPDRCRDDAGTFGRLNVLADLMVLVLERI